MARNAAADGTRILLATPHQRDVMLNSSADQVREIAAGLTVELQRGDESVPIRVRVLLGMENHIEPDLPDWYDQGRALPINGTRFILAEPPFTAYPRYVDDVLARLRLKRLVPVLAHPERNVVLQRNPRKLQSLIEGGMLVQLTAGSLTGVFGQDARSAAELFIRTGMAHVVASDMHRPDGPRSPELSAAYDRVVELAGEDEADRLFEICPGMILEGRQPRTEIVESEAAGRRWWQVRLPWRRQTL